MQDNLEYLTRLGLAEKTRAALADGRFPRPIDLYRAIKQDEYRWDKVLYPVTADEALSCLWQMLSTGEQESTRLKGMDLVYDYLIRTANALAFLAVICFVLFGGCKAILP